MIEQFILSFQEKEPVILGLEILISIGILIFSIMLVSSLFNQKVNQLRHTFTDILQQQREVNYSHYVNSNRGVQIEMNLLDKFQMKFIERTNMKHYISFMNVYIVIVIISVIFLFSTILIVPIVGNWITAIILGSIVASIPLLGLDLLSKSISERSRRDLYSYISTLRTWANVKADIIFIFSKVASDFDGPLAKHTEQMVTQLKSGLDPEIAMEILRMKVNNPYFDTFILNVTHAFTNQGDLVKLLSKLEKEAFRLERAYHDRKMKTLMDRVMVFGFMIVTLVLSLSLLAGNSSIRTVFVESSTGQVVLSVAFIAFAIGLFNQFKITSFEH
jgi:hypothetical protein